MNNEITQWLLVGLVLAGLLGYRAVQRAAARREAARKVAAEQARLLAQRKAAAQEAARAEAARRAEAETARANAEAARVVEARRAAEAARAEAARLAAVDEAARVAAERAAAEAASRARVAAAREAARLAAEQAAAVTVPAPLSAPEIAPPARTQAPRKTRDQTLVMVADDSKIVRVKTGRLLEQHRYRVTYAIDGFDAAQQLRSQAPDIVITDVEMPGMDGFELTRHVRENPLTAHIPVIMITAAEDKHRADAQRAGVSMLLGKPYPEDALIGHIRMAMGDLDA